MEYRLIKVYENSDEYQYENLFLVRINERQYSELLKAIEKYDSLDYEEAQDIYGMGKIEFVENYIINNLEVIKTDIIDIDCY